MPPVDNVNAQPPSAPPSNVAPAPVGQQPPQPNFNNQGLKSGSPLFSKSILAFVLMFALIGGYFIFRSFAASLSNESEILSSFHNLSNKQVSQIQTTASVIYGGGNTTFKSAGLSSTTSFDKYNSSSTIGSLSVLRGTTSQVFPFEVRLLGGFPLLKLSNSANLKTAFPAGSSLTNFLQNHDSKYLSRLDNNWYAVASDGQDANQAPSIKGLGCLVNTQLVPDSSDLSAITAAYTQYSPLTINKASAPNKQTVYTITPSSNANNLNSFVNGLSSLNYFKGINDCSMLTVHSKVTDKLLSSNAGNSFTITITLDSNKRITKITFSNSGNGKTPKATVNVTSTFAYGKKAADIQWPVGIGDFNAYYRYLNKPTTGENNSQFSFKLPSGWGSDYCPFDDNEYVSVALYTDGPSTGSFCAYTNSRVSLNANQYTYDDSGGGYAATLATPTGKKNKALAAIGDKNPVVANRTRSQQSNSNGPKCTQDKSTTSTVVVDGKNMTRTQTIYGSCNLPYIKTGTKAVFYDYSKDDPTSPTTGTYSYFNASYWQEPKDKDVTSTFDNMVKTVNLTW